MKRAATLLLAAFMLVVPATALAAERRDPDDTSAKLDIVKLKYSRPLMEQAVLRINTQNPWRCVYLNNDGVSLRWHFDGANDATRTWSAASSAGTNG